MPVFTAVLAAAALTAPSGAPSVSPSFDCSRATGGAERRVCENRRLADLDAELAQTYRDATKRAPLGLRDSQREWLARRRNSCETDGCLEREYLVRIEQLRLADRDRLFGRERPPPLIFGLYSQKTRTCSMEEDETGQAKCWDATSFVRVARGMGHVVHVEFELVFHNGHTCGGEGAAEWSGSTLLLPSEDLDVNRCVLLLSFTESRVEFSDPENRCRQLACGTRGVLDGSGVDLLTRHPEVHE